MEFLQELLRMNLQSWRLLPRLAFGGDEWLGCAAFSAFSPTCFFLNEQGEGITEACDWSAFAAGLLASSVVVGFDCEGCACLGEDEFCLIKMVGLNWLASYRGPVLPSSLLCEVATCCMAEARFLPGTRREPEPEASRWASSARASCVCEKL